MSNSSSCWDCLFCRSPVLPSDGNASSANPPNTARSTKKKDTPRPEEPAKSSRSFPTPAPRDGTNIKTVTVAARAMNVDPPTTSQSKPSRHRKTRSDVVDFTKVMNQLGVTDPKQIESALNKPSSRPATAAKRSPVLSASAAAYVQQHPAIESSQKEELTEEDIGKSDRGVRFNKKYISTTMELDFFPNLVTHMGKQINADMLFLCSHDKKIHAITANALDLTKFKALELIGKKIDSFIFQANEVDIFSKFFVTALHADKRKTNPTMTTSIGIKNELIGSLKTAMKVRISVYPSTELSIVSISKIDLSAEIRLEKARNEATVDAAKYAKENAEVAEEARRKFAEWQAKRQFDQSSGNTAAATKVGSPSGLLSPPSGVFSPESSHVMSNSVVSAESVRSKNETGINDRPGAFSPSTVLATLQEAGVDGTLRVRNTGEEELHLADKIQPPPDNFVITVSDTDINPTGSATAAPPSPASEAFTHNALVSQPQQTNDDDEFYRQFKEDPKNLMPDPGYTLARPTTPKTEGATERVSPTGDRNPSPIYSPLPPMQARHVHFSESPTHLSAAAAISPPSPANSKTKSPKRMTAGAPIATNVPRKVETGRKHYVPDS